MEIFRHFSFCIFLIDYYARFAKFLVLAATVCSLFPARSFAQNPTPNTSPRQNTVVTTEKNNLMPPPDRLAPIRTAIPQSLSAPFLIPSPKDNNPLNDTDGLVHDYVAAIAAELKREVKFSVLPKYRLDDYFSRGLIDINCFTSPAWVPDGKYLWSETVFTKNEVLAGLSSGPQSLAQLKEQSVGTVVGYRYPVLEPYFKKKSLRREDAASEEASLAKMMSRRLSYVVIDDVTLAYYLKQQGKPEVINSRISLEKTEIKCQIHPNSSVSLKDINLAIGKLKKSGQLKALFEKYR